MFKLRGLTITLVTLACMLCAFASTSVAADSSTYQDPNGAYNFTLPDGWQGPVTKDGGTIAFNDTVNGTVLVIASTPTNGLSLSDVYQAFTSTFPQEPGYQADPAGVTDVTLGGQPAKGFSFHSNNTDGSPISTGVLATVNKDTAYLLLFLTTPDKEQASSPGVGTILSSWQFAS